MRPIDADELYIDIATDYDGNTYNIIYANDVDNAPTLDVRENVRAHWYKPQGMMPPEHHGHYECSHCGGWAVFNWKHRLELTKYCPHCGAEIIDEENE